MQELRVFYVVLLEVKLVKSRLEGELGSKENDTASSSDSMDPQGVYF